MKLLLLILLALTQATVIQLDKTNFQKAVQEHPLLLVKFYIEGCVYCTQMKPVFEKLSDQLGEYEFVLAEVNAAENKVLAAKNKVQSYPSLVLYRDGKPENFPNSSTSLQLLFEYALQHSYGLVTKLTSQKEIDLFLKRTEIAVVSYKNNIELSGQAVANLQVKFGSVTDNSLQQLNEYKIFVHNKYLPEALVYDGNINDLNTFINNKGYPEVFTYTEAEYNKAKTDKKPLLAIISPESEMVYRRLRYVSNSYKGEYQLVQIDPNSELALRRFKHQVGLVDDLMANYLYYYNFTQLQLVKIEQDDVADIKDYVENLVHKPESFIEANGQVNEFSSNNFQRQVIQNPNHVLVKFFAPWCGHCKQLAPIYEDLASKLQTLRSDIIIGKIDSTEHKIDSIKIDGYPTIILFKKIDGQVQQIEFEGGRSVEEFIKFFDKHIPAIKKPNPNGFPNSSALEIRTENFNQIWDSDQDALLWFYSPNCEHSSKFNSVYEEIYQKYKDDLVIGRTDGTINKYPDFSVDSYPQIYLITKNKQIIKFEGEDRSLLKLSEFIDLNKRPIEETLNEGKVVTITAANFRNTVLNTPKTVLVKFYAPWCGHCKAMSEEYNKLAANLSNREDVLVAEMDWTVHRVDDVDIKGFPTLILFRKNPSAQIRYEGARTAEGLAQFIQTHLAQIQDDL